MSKENKTKEDLCRGITNTRPMPMAYIYEVMDQWAEIKSRERTIAFFKWYALKMVGFIEYIKDIRPTVTSNEIEEKIKEFEGQPIEILYELFSQQIENKNAEQ